MSLDTDWLTKYLQYVLADIERLAIGMTIVIIMILVLVLFWDCRKTSRRWKED